MPRSSLPSGTTAKVLDSLDNDHFSLALRASVQLLAVLRGVANASLRSKSKELGAPIVELLRASEPLKSRDGGEE